MIKKIANYQNGNTFVTIYEDGTKIRKYDDPVIVEFPESMDVKITNYCDLDCKFCHEMSDKNGIHADLEILLQKLEDLPAGIELAIGGGNPLSHPNIVAFLERLRNKGFIPNLTMNQRHLKKYRKLLEYLIENQLIFGLGISINNKDFKEIESLMDITKNIVFHLIAGVNDVKEIEELRRLPYCKILVLGYKNVGRGKDFFNPEVSKNLFFWNAFVGKYLSEGVLSFDNLAIEQLYIQKMLTKKEWERYYLGDDFTFSMYIDVVKQEFAPSSTSTERKSFKDYSLKNYFLNFRNKNN